MIQLVAFIVIGLIIIQLITLVFIMRPLRSTMPEWLNNKFYRVEMPPGWSVTNDCSGIVSSDGSKAIFISTRKNCPDVCIATLGREIAASTELPVEYLGGEHGRSLIYEDKGRTWERTWIMLTAAGTHFEIRVEGGPFEELDGFLSSFKTLPGETDYERVFEALTSKLVRDWLSFASPGLTEINPS